MTIYICQCPHRLPARVWTADSEDEAIGLVAGDDETSFDSALDAARDDMRDAYVTDDALDLFLWCSTARAAIDTRARAAFFADPTVKMDIEALADRSDIDDDISYTAFDGRFTWSENDGEWRLDNQPPEPADDLFHALAEASLVIALRERMEQSDV